MSDDNSTPGVPAVFYDGLIARRRAVMVILHDDNLVISDGDGMLAAWRYPDLREQDAPTGFLRLAAQGAPELARLEIADTAFAAEIRRRAPLIRDTARARRSGKIQIVAWSMAAAVSLVLTAIYLVPLLADRVTPLIPLSVERRLGDAVAKQVHVIFKEGACLNDDGEAALATMEQRLAPGLPPDALFDIRVLASPVANAFALPGGRIYLLRGLIDKAESAEEVAGVLAHEMGHVAHRDGLRRLLQSGGSSFLIGLLFGDVFGGGTLITLGQTLVNSAYSREQETDADAFAANVFLRIGQSPKPLGTFLSRIAKDDKTMTRFALLLSHPLSQARLAALSGREPTHPSPPLLTEAEWRALKGICGEAKP